MKRSRAVWAILLVICMMTQLFVMMPASAEPSGSGTVTAGKLQVEYQTNPLGLDNTAPRFSWELNSKDRGVTQESYRILVADSEENLANGTYVWDSGIVPGADTFGVTYEGADLEPTTRYYWKVISTTNKGVAETVDWWETGLMNDKIDAWDGAEWLTKPVGVSNPDIDNYTVEWDFSMVKDGASLRFASNGGYYLVWQFNINPVEQHFGGEPRFRPHAWNTGGACLDNFSVANIIPNNDEGKSAWYTCKVVVTKSGSSYYATTYLGPKGEELTKIDNNRQLPTNHNWSVGKLGFRQYRDANNKDDAYFDNIKVFDNTDGASNLIYSEDFEGTDVPAMFKGHGSIENGTYRVGNGSHEDFEANYKVVDPEPAPGGDPLFRKDFTVDKPVKSARLYATARGIYEFSLNGEKVGDQYLAPGWTDYKYTLMYQTYDVTGMLSDGANAIGAMIGQGWWSSPEQGASYNYPYGETQSVLGKLVITYEDGTTQTIVTDDSWSYHPGPVIYADNYAGEYYDARYDCDGWNTAGYTGEGWTAAGIEKPLDADVNIVSQTGEAIREVDRFSDPVITEPVEGRYTFDFGQNMAGFLRLKVKGEAGSTITIKHAEMLNTDKAYKKDGKSVGGGDDLPGTIYRANLRDAYSRGRKVAIDTYTFKGDPNGEEWTPRFTFHGFRYVEITGIDSLDDILEIEAIAISSDNELTTTFETSNQKVNQLYSNIIWGMRGNFVSVPTDCPNRDERLGYTGDTQVFAGTGVYFANSNQFYSKWLRDLRDYQLNETTGDAYGRVPVIIPLNNRTGGWPSNWSSAWSNAAVIVPWQLYQQYGDVQIIKDAFQSMKAWCDYQMHPKRSTNYLRHGDAASGDQDNNYGDWLAVEGSDKSLTNSLYMAYDFRTFSIMARTIGETAIADEYEETGKKIVNAIMDKWGTEDGNLNVNTQTPLALFLHFGLDKMTDRADSAKIAQKLMENVRDHGWKLTVGFIGVNALVPALSNNGQMEAALRLLEQEEYPSWIYSINQGATTTWERWNSYTTANGFGDAGMNSFNHYSYGAIGEWLISGALGIQRDEANPGFRHFTLNP
ncbi:MAG: family 78 glycoside hydrolase catalytic domain, partial [Clostridiales bacterium]|nr:family 78 glycoside hydrolase catalytic domain [Clostridiales bacterium]